MSVVAVPQAISSNRKWIRLAIAAGVALALVFLAVGATTIWGGSSGGAPVAGMFQPVQRIDMDVIITKDGELRAVNNIDIVSRVQGQNTIQQIVAEGSAVKKGDVLVVFDSSEIQRKIEEFTLEVQKAEAALTTAQEQEEIQKSQNAANLLDAEVSLELAKIDLRSYEEGTYPAELTELVNKRDMAKVTLKNKEDDLAQTRSLFDKGFVTAADLKKAEYEVIWGKNDLELAEKKLMVQKEYTFEKEMTDRKNKVIQAERKLVRVKKENASNLAQKTADVISKQQTLELQKYRLAHYQEQLERTVIKSPTDGMVVYPEESRRQSTPLQEGSKIMESQRILTLPDTREMMASVRINESQVSKIRVDEDNPMRASVKIVGVPEPVGATVKKVSVIADGSQRWWNPDLKEYPVDLVLDWTPPNCKPGMTVQAQIFVARLDDVLAVPVSSIYSVGTETYAFVRDRETARPVKIEVGQTNTTHAEVLSGLDEAEEVLVLESGQGQKLLEQAGIKVRPTTRPSFDKESGPPAPNGAQAKAS